MLDRTEINYRMDVFYLVLIDTLGTRWLSSIASLPVCLENYIGSNDRTIVRSGAA